MIEEKPPFQLVAGHVALDFANTLDNRYDPKRVIDLIAGYADLLRFCTQAGVLRTGQADHLREKEARGEAVLQSAIELREALYRIFRNAAEGKCAAQGDLNTLARWIIEGAQHREIRCHEPAVFEWHWRDLEDDPGSPLWLIGERAAELLVSPDISRVRECASETCRWLFLDTSKNHSRRWCDMKLCGNRVKARNYYQRERGQQSAR